MADSQDNSIRWRWTARAEWSMWLAAAVLLALSPAHAASFSVALAQATAAARPLPQPFVAQHLAFQQRVFQQEILQQDAFQQRAAHRLVAQTPLPVVGIEALIASFGPIVSAPNVEAGIAVPRACADSIGQHHPQPAGSFHLLLPPVFSPRRDAARRLAHRTLTAHEAAFLAGARANRNRE